MAPDNLDEIRGLPIKKVASRLGIKVLPGNKSMCFRSHDVRTPSLSFWLPKNAWKCFGCGLGGGVIDLVMQAGNMDFRMALDWLRSEFGLGPRWVKGNRSVVKAVAPLKRHQVDMLGSTSASCRGVVNDPDPELYGWFLGRCGVVAQPIGLDYLRGHAISLEVANRFGVRELRDPARAFRRLLDHWGPDRLAHCGLAFISAGTPRRLVWSSYSLLFPFCKDGAVEYIQGRRFAGEPKYLNPKGIPKPLYNKDRLSRLPFGEAIHICEGIPDALALETRGLPAVAVLGASSFRAEWVDGFMPYDIVLLPDGDRGGDTFRRTVSQLFAARGKAVHVVRPESGKDVADVAAAMGGTG
jgi:DNA primase